MSKRYNKSFSFILSKGIADLDITGQDFAPRRNYKSNVVASWENVGTYFKCGFNRALSGFQKECTE